MAENTLQAAVAAARDALARARTPEGWQPLPEVVEGPRGVAAPSSSRTAEQLRALMADVARLEAQVDSLRLHVVAAAESANVALAAGQTDTEAWAAQASGNRARAWGHAWLATALRETFHQTEAALADGTVSEDHAAILVRAARGVPGGLDSLPRDRFEECERELLEKARWMSPSRFRRAARRFLEPISRELADVHENDLLEKQEQRAERETWFVLDDNGDGTWTGKFVLPELHALILKKACEKLSAPRRRGRGGRARDGAPMEDATVPGERLSHPEAMGVALCELAEHLPEVGHSRTGIHLVVHIDEQHLRQGVGAAALDAGGSISASEARRLACNAGHLPVVLGGDSVPLDLGQSQRLFTRHQWTALSALWSTCAAGGCDRPIAWCELHHLKPWGAGGPTDLANAVPLCWWHHRRIHDERFHHWQEPDGTITFERRRPRRRSAPPGAVATRDAAPPSDPATRREASRLADPVAEFAAAAEASRWRDSA